MSKNNDQSQKPWNLILDAVKIIFFKEYFRSFNRFEKSREDLKKKNCENAREIDNAKDTK